MLSVPIVLAAAGTAIAQPSYPSKPIRIIVPFAPGGSNDLLARLFGPKMTEKWGQPVIVENRGGGSTVIGTEALVKSPPDGYTILFMNMAHVTTPLLVASPYDPIKDFATIATSAKSEYMVIRPLVSQCKFNNCSHTREPGCAVRTAVDAGRLHPERYESYVRLRLGNN